jgi:hypothetical protein
LFASVATISEAVKVHCIGCQLAIVCDEVWSKLSFPLMSVVWVAAFTVKFGYVQVTDVMFVQAVMTTVWSGAEFVTTNLFSSAQVHSATLIPVPAITLSATYQAVGSPASYFTFSSVHQVISSNNAIVQSLSGKVNVLSVDVTQDISIMPYIQFHHILYFFVSALITMF